jgi:hypothetical protein
MLLYINIKEEQRFAPIRWKDDFYNIPFFECAATDSSKVENTGAVHRRHKENYYGAGLPTAPNFHDTRRFQATKVGKLESPLPYPFGC